MAEIRETHVERDADGRIVDTKVTIGRPRNKGGFTIGMLLGVLLIAGAVIAFAYSQGSFQQAGVKADVATAQVQQSTSDVVNKTVGNEQQAANQTSETAAN